MTTPHPPGTEVWVAPDLTEYRVVRATVVKFVEFAGCYELVAEGGEKLYGVWPRDAFATEADAVADLRQYAAETINAAQERIAAAEAFLGRPSICER